MGGLASSFERKGMGRSHEIERANKEFGGLLDIFEGQGVEVQNLILAEVARLKEKCAHDPEQFALVIRALAEVCREATRGLEPGIRRDEIRRTLVDQFEEMEAALENAKAGSQEKGKEMLH